MLKKPDLSEQGEMKASPAGRNRPSTISQMNASLNQKWNAVGRRSTKKEGENLSHTVGPSDGGDLSGSQANTKADLQARLASVKAKLAGMKRGKQ